MMCEVMPTINEDTPMSQRGSQSSGSDSDSHFEQLMVNMLDERDRLLDTLRETQESLSLAQQRLQDVIYDRDSLQRQLNSALPQDIESLTGSLTGSKGADPPAPRGGHQHHPVASDCGGGNTEQWKELSTRKPSGERPASQWDWAGIVTQRPLILQLVHVSIEDKPKQQEKKKELNQKKGVNFFTQKNKLYKDVDEI
uniref:PTPRF interacting protein alpha 2 n=1 Tax=Rousettus aegyptiacus TaxID=9407 RepID=A0A7J8JLJ1_ROUAE|nr:PTPRF interacting protein alpha 2 [Rousettus aegyptiacus]